MPSGGQETRRSSDAALMSGVLANGDLVALALADRDRIRAANGAFSRLFGRHDRLRDVALPDLLLPQFRERVAATLQAAGSPQPPCLVTATRDEGATIDVELRFEHLHHNGESLVVIAAQDVTDRRRAEEQLNLLAYSDPLTGLANRALFTDRLRQAVLVTRRTAQASAVLLLDLDQFKPVNDTHGHEAGDYVLWRIARRMLAALRESDTIARLGGDEFAVLLPAVKRSADVIVVAELLTRLARQPILYGKSELRVSTSVGIAICPEHATTVDLLFAAADAALYVAKREGRDRWAWAKPASATDTVPMPQPWDRAHEVGVRAMDEQHAHLGALLNGLANVLRNGLEYAAIFQEIVAYTQFHFAYEERLMADCRYDGAALHQLMHRRLLEDLRSLHLEGRENAGFSASMTMRWLQDWLLRHIDGADRDLAAALHRAAEE